MAGTGLKIAAGLIFIPLHRFVSNRLEDAWRASTGTEPPSDQRRKEQIKANKEAEKLGLIPRPVDEPKLVDALMWAALSAMSIIAVKYAAERGAEEVHRWVTGRNPSPEDRSALVSSTAVGMAQGHEFAKQGG